jgi:hypothetical protein
LTRRLTGERLRRDGVIPLLIDHIKTILSAPASEEAAVPAARQHPERIERQETEGND